MRAIETLLRASIDYAGLFPPASLDLPASVSNYARYLSGKHAWALGRFILPAARLREFEEVAGIHLAAAASPGWMIAALAGPDLASDLQRIAEFNQRRHAARSGTRIDTVELKAGSIAAIQSTMAQVPPELQAYLEIPIDEDPLKLIVQIQRSGASAKVRTGAITSDGFPRPEQLVRFVEHCIRAGIRFKATAGLHHAFRGEYRLTYERDSPTGFMYGFLNLFLTAGFLLNGLPGSEAQQVLEESSRPAFQVRDDEITWRNHRLDLAALEETRKILTSFGSCSFSEPIEELEALQLVESGAQRA